MSHHKKIQMYRYKRGHSYQQVEHATKIPLDRIKRFERGQEPLTLKELETLLSFYEITWDDFHQLGKSDKKRFPTKFILSLSVLFLLALVGLHFQNEITQWRILQKVSLVYSQETPPQAQAPSFPKDESGKKPERTENDGSTVTFRFWGNILYNADSLPAVPGQNRAEPIMEVFPVEHVEHADTLPSWLKTKDPTRVLLNAGTADVKTKTTLQEYQRWKERGYSSIGFKKAPDVYRPFILEAGDTKIGIVSLARVVHSIHDAASKYQAGLPKAYDRSLIKDTIQKAKQQSDLVIVLSDWGKTWGIEPESYQKQMAADIVSAGGDLIVGNHPFQSQPMGFIQDKPLFHSLGHSISSFKDRSSYNYLLEIDIKNRNIQEMRVIIGKIENGVLLFELSNEDKEKIKQTYVTRFPTNQRVKFVY